jgi:signal transduction histidine kinase
MKPGRSSEAIETFWRRLADVHLFTLGYFAFHVFGMVSMRIFLNYETLIDAFGFWAAIFALEHVLIFAVYGFSKLLIRRYSSLLVVSGALIMGFFRTLLTTELALQYGIDANVAWGFQLVTGALYELVMVGVWANVNGAYRSHKAVITELNATKNEILGYRENAEQILQEQQEGLISLTQRSLLPQIKLLEESVSNGGASQIARWGVAQELKGLINNQVRPLSEALRQSAKALTKPGQSTKGPIVSMLAIPSKFRITNSIFPVTNYVTILLGFIAAPYWVMGFAWVPISTLLSITYYLVLIALKKLTSNWPVVSAWVGVPVLMVFSILPALPAYAIAVAFYPNTEQAVVYGLSMMTLSAVVFLSLALLDSFDFGSQAYREQLDEEVQTLAYETALFEQQLWAARRNWSLVVHGSVQASLTAALTRLNAADADEKTNELARKDLERAMAALTNPPAVELDLNKAIEQLVDTWQGVCDIEFEISAELKEIASHDSGLALCVNEILKEAISNAVRHGDARNAKVEMKLIDGDVVEVRVSNNGTPPRRDLRKGLGSALLDELTLAWKLSTAPSGNQTALLVTLPFSKLPA